MAFNNSSNAQQQGVQYLSSSGVWTGEDGGTAGHILTSNGTGVAPTFQAPASGSVTIAGDSGSISGSSLKIYADQVGNNAGASVSFSNSGTTSTLNLSDGNGNVFLGNGAGISGLAGAINIGIGSSALGSLTSGTYNVGIGNSSLALETSGGDNIAIGKGCLSSSDGGNYNTALGVQAATNMTAGQNNIILGYLSGNGYTSTEHDNICISASGAPGDANTLRLGTQGTGTAQQDKCFIAGITGATPTSANTPQVVLCDNAGNLAPISSSTSGFVLTSNGSSTPSFQANPASSAVTTIDGDSGSCTPSSGVVTISGGTTGLTTTASSHTMDLTGTLALANGGTNASLTASNGGIFYSTASAGAILSGTSTAKQMLQSGASTTPAWSTATWPATTTANDLLYSSSNNVVGQITASANGVLISSNSDVPSWLANSSTAGYVLTANSGAPPSWQSISSSSTSWTPGVAFGGGTTGITYSLQSGSYIQLGNLVVAGFVITVSNKGSSSGAATITGLPVSMGSNAHNYTCVCGGGGFTLGGTYSVLLARGTTSASTLDLTTVSPTGGTYNTVPDTSFSTSFTVTGTIIYTTN
jgi:hypothetical protein